MLERKQLRFLSIGGVILLVLGLCVLILPKLTSLTFHMVLGSAFIIYGIFKAISSIIVRLPKIFICEMILGVYLVATGILTIMIPRMNIYLVITLIAIYLLLESLMISSYFAYFRNVLRCCHLKCPIIFVMLLASLLILVKLPNISFITVAIIIGVCYVIKGMKKIVLSKINDDDFYLDDEEDDEPMESDFNDERY